MSISKEDVDKIARLAKLELSEEERIKFAKQLGDIISYVEKLDEVDISNVEPLAHVNDLTNVSREDKSRPSFSWFPTFHSELTVAPDVNFLSC